MKTRTLMIIVWIILIIFAFSMVFYIETIKSQEIDDMKEICIENNGDYLPSHYCVIGDIKYDIVDTINGWRLVKT